MSWDSNSRLRRERKVAQGTEIGAWACWTSGKVSRGTGDVPKLFLDPYISMAASGGASGLDVELVVLGAPVKNSTLSIGFHVTISCHLFSNVLSLQSLPRRWLCHKDVPLSQRRFAWNGSSGRELERDCTTWAIRASSTPSCSA